MPAPIFSGGLAVTGLSVAEGIVLVLHVCVRYRYFFRFKAMEWFTWYALQRQTENDRYVF